MTSKCSIFLKSALRLLMSFLLIHIHPSHSLTSELQFSPAALEAAVISLRSQTPHRCAHRGQTRFVFLGRPVRVRVWCSLMSTLCACKCRLMFRLSSFKLWNCPLWVHVFCLSVVSFFLLNLCFLLVRTDRHHPVRLNGCWPSPVRLRANLTLSEPFILLKWGGRLFLFSSPFQP